MMPTSSKVPWVGEKPFSSASTPKTSEPPVFGVAVETPSGWVPVEPPDVVELELELELPQAASTLPAAMPAPATALLARNERRSMRSVMIPLRTVAPAAPVACSMRCCVRPACSVRRLSPPRRPPRGRRVPVLPRADDSPRRPGAWDKSLVATDRAVGRCRVAPDAGGCPPVRSTGGLGDRGLPPLGRRPVAGHRPGLRLRRRALRRVGGPRGRRRARPTSTGSRSAATSPSWPPGATPRPPSPARRRRCAPTSAGAPAGA